MTISWQAIGDLVDVADAWEPLTLAWPDGRELSVPRAWRGRVGHREPRDGGRAWVGEVRFLLPTEGLTLSPEPGVVAIDGGGEAWSAVAWLHRAAAGYWELTARRWDAAGGLKQRVDLWRATWSKDAHGAATPAWRPWQLQLRAAVQPWHPQAVGEGRSDLVATHRILLARSLELQGSLRVVQRGAGRWFRVLSWRMPESSGQPLTLEARLLEA